MLQALLLRLTASCASLVALTVSTALPPIDPSNPRVVIGEVLGVPVYRDEVDAENTGRRRDLLMSRFCGDVFARYRVFHDEEITPTDAEVVAVTQHLEALHRDRLATDHAPLLARLAEVEGQLKLMDLTPDRKRDLYRQQWELRQELKPPGMYVARFMLTQWKLQKHLYDHHGGGRVLWQQTGMEAIDATHRFLIAEEEAGRIRFTDPAMRTEFYRYWTEMMHDPSLIDDEERIQREFLQPDWLPKTK